MFSNPIIGEKFFGRGEVLEILRRRTTALKEGYRQNIAITGPRLSGKSSVLLQFITTLKDTDVITIYLEIRQESFEQFAERFITTLLYSFLKASGSDTSGDLPVLIERGKSIIPKTIMAIEEIRRDLAAREINRAYPKLLSLTSGLREETGKPCIIILDECHNLAAFSIKNPFIQLGKKIMVQHNTMYVISSSQLDTIRKILSEKLSLLFGSFEVVELGGFTPNLSIQFLEERSRPVKISDECKLFLLYLTGGHPFYLDIISSELRKSNYSGITLRSLPSIFEQLMLASIGSLNQYFNNYLYDLIRDHPSNDYPDILLAVSNGNYKTKDIISYIGKKIKDLGKKLNTLVEMGIVSQCGVFYYFDDKMLEFWLKAVYKLRREVLVSALDAQSSNFQELMLDLITKYTVETKKDAAVRLSDLFSLFNNETVQFGKKLHKLPRFSKIELMAYQDTDTHCLLGQTKEKYWLCEILQKDLSEEDVTKFIDLGKKTEKQIIKKVLITFGAIDINARLLANENKIWLLDRQEINKLFNLYKKFKLIERG